MTRRGKRFNEAWCCPLKSSPLMMKPCRAKVCYGAYPSFFLEAWDEYQKQNGSHNERPGKRKGKKGGEKGRKEGRKDRVNWATHYLTVRYAWGYGMVLPGFNTGRCWRGFGDPGCPGVGKGLEYLDANGTDNRLC